jgi:hypothetical protein
VVHRHLSPALSPAAAARWTDSDSELDLEPEAAPEAARSPEHQAALQVTLPRRSVQSEREWSCRLRVY